MIGLLATRLAGSSDLYQASEREPYHSINFITSHDGFTLNDLVSYSEKHNEANGEDSHDGERNNYSYNYGVEGPTRGRRGGPPAANPEPDGFALVEPGSADALAGDECRRTQAGNNNPYCQDNEITWVNWKLVEKHQAWSGSARRWWLFAGPSPPCGRRTSCWVSRPSRRFARRKLVHTQRRAGGLVGRLAEPGAVSGRGPAEDQLRQSSRVDAIPCRHRRPALHRAVVGRSIAWRLFVDTAAESPADIYPALDGPSPPANGIITLQARSLMVYVAGEGEVF